MAAPFGSQNIASTGSPYATEAGYTNFFKVAYSNTIRMHSMRLESQLANAFERESIMGAPLVVQQVKRVEEGFETYGDADAAVPDANLSKNRNRTGALVARAVPTETRSVVPDHWDFMHRWDWRDRKSLLRDARPGSPFISTVNGSFNRKIDKHIIEGLDADVTVDGSSTNFTSDGGFTVGVASGFPDVLTGHNTDDAASQFKLTTEKMIDARFKLENADIIGHGEFLLCIMSPRQARFLLQNDTNIRNSDFADRKALQIGGLISWLGMRIIVTTAIEEIDTNASKSITAADADPFALGANVTTQSQSETGEYAYVCTPDALLVGADPIQVMFDVIPEDGHSLQVAHYSSVGVLRLQGQRVCRIQCMSGNEPA